jgi:hypothetical protein
MVLSLAQVAGQGGLELIYDLLIYAPILVPAVRIVKPWLLLHGFSTTRCYALYERDPLLEANGGAPR